MQKFILLWLILFSVNGLHAQKDSTRYWKNVLNNTPADNYFCCFHISKNKVAKRYFYFKKDNIGYLAFSENKKLVKVIPAKEDYYKQLDEDFEYIQFLTNNLIWVSKKLWPNYYNKPNKDKSEYKSIAMKYNGIHCNHYRLPEDTTGLRYEFKVAYGIFDGIVEKMEAAFEAPGIID